MSFWLKRLAAVMFVSMVAACGGSDDDPGTVADEASRQNLTALVAASAKAGLVPALSSSSSNLTVFAPTDAAFTAFATTLGFSSASAMVAALDGRRWPRFCSTTCCPRASRRPIWRPAARRKPTLYTFEGAQATLALDTSSGVKITDEVLTQANVVSANVPASNGVIHVIDKVLVPPGVLNVVQMAQLNPSFSVLVEAVVAANLATTLSGAGPFTVFAPINDAFTAALTELGLSKAQLLASPSLAGILTYHVVSGNVRRPMLSPCPSPPA